MSVRSPDARLTAMDRRMEVTAGYPVRAPPGIQALGQAVYRLRVVGSSPQPQGEFYYSRLVS